jgi:hypothetical protein
MALSQRAELSLDQLFQFFIHLKEEKNLFALCVAQGRQLIRLDSGCDLVADVVDAEHMSRQQRAP